MDMGVNLNNMVINNFSNNLVQVNQSVKMDNSAFLKMMKMIMGENNNSFQIEPASSTNSNLDILQLLTDSNVNVSELNISDNVELLETDANIISSRTEEEETIEKPLDNLYDSESFIFMNTDFINIDFVNDMSLGNKENIEYFQSLIPNMKKNEYQNTGYSTYEKQNNKTHVRTTSIFEVPIKEKVPEIKNSSEKSISEIEFNKQKVKNEKDFNAELLSQNSRNLAEVSNKVITISDEASEIKSQVLSQVRDKIVFMVEEVAKDSNAVKNVVMELHPNNLGKVDIKMTFENNKITVEIKALKEETQKILSSNVEELANVLGKTNDSAVKIIIKPSELLNENQPLRYDQNNDQKNEQYYDRNDEQNNGHSRHKNNFYYEDNTKDNEEDNIFSQLINLRDIRLKSV